MTAEDSVGSNRPSVSGFVGSSSKPSSSYTSSSSSARFTSGLLLLLLLLLLVVVVDVIGIGGVALPSGLLDDSSTVSSIYN